MKPSKPTYASKAQIGRAISAMSDAGYRLGGVTLHVDGSIEVRFATNDNSEMDEFDQLEADGRL